MEVGIHTQTGVAKGLKVPCLFMINEVSIRCQKTPEVGIRRIPAYTPPPIHHWLSFTTLLTYLPFMLVGIICFVCLYLCRPIWWNLHHLVLSYDQLWAASLLGRNAVTWRVDHCRMINASRSTVVPLHFSALSSLAAANSVLSNLTDNGESSTKTD